MVPHSSTLAWKILWTEEPGGLQSMRSLRVRHDWASSLSLFTFMHWRRKWQPIPVFLPGESQGWEPGGLPSMGSHRVGHDWSNLAAAAAKDHPRLRAPVGWQTTHSSTSSCFPVSLTGISPKSAPQWTTYRQTSVSGSSSTSVSPSVSQKELPLIGEFCCKYNRAWILGNQRKWNMSQYSLCPSTFPC